MSTRSNIVIEHKSGFVEVIYCHFDGYPSGVGQVLFQFYKDDNKIQNLINNGAISSIEIEDSSENHYQDRPAKKYDNLDKYIENVSKDIFIEYIYLWKKEEQKWYFSANFDKPIKWKLLKYWKKYE